MNRTKNLAGTSLDCEVWYLRNGRKTLIGTVKAIPVEWYGDIPETIQKKVDAYFPKYVFESFIKNLRWKTWNPETEEILIDIIEILRFAGSTQEALKLWTIWVDVTVS